jgi:hypothetical protein
MGKYSEELEKHNEELQERLATTERWYLQWHEGDGLWYFGIYKIKVAFVNKIKASTWRAVLTMQIDDGKTVSDFKSKKDAMAWVEKRLSEK